MNLSEFVQKICDDKKVLNNQEKANIHFLAQNDKLLHKEKEVENVKKELRAIHGR